MSQKADSQTKTNYVIKNYNIIHVHFRKQTLYAKQNCVKHCFL